MNFPYIIIDDDQESVLKTKAIADGFSELVFVASANNYADGLNLILEHSPKLIFLEIDPADTTSNLSLALINELYRFLKVIPKIIITTGKKDLAFEAIQYEVTDYMIKPLRRIDFIKSILKIKKAIEEDEVSITQNQLIKTPQELKVEQSKSTDDFQESIEEKILVLNKNTQDPIVKEPKATSEDTTEEDILALDEISAFSEEQIPEVYLQQSNPNIEQPLILCIKSYGDYRYIDTNDICFFQADNNSTDIHLNNGEMVTAFKTLKHFEGVLPYPFARIHNSYIVNRNYISRIHTGNAVCYIKNTTTKLPFSKSYKENVDLIISEFANGNYLEI
ncbi:LytR/AlgR family response regulator transcription factor [Flavobacterium franklandianum]|uniref:LytR/AlgR family response regulator transcription factor n=1 Tax=Flavobacterium franklandianum TaxID=2594430 RepID=UPI001F38760C|nr:LytTR family DNA-binding domain-containing protein [Flavobacterium franklandianum]